MLQFTWLFLTNQTSLFKYNVVMLLWNLFMNSGSSLPDISSEIWVGGVDGEPRWQGDEEGGHDDAEERGRDDVEPDLKVHVRQVRVEHRDRSIHIEIFVYT